MLEGLLVADEGELAAGVEPVVQAGAAGEGRDDDHQGVFGRVVFGWRVDVVQGFWGGDAQVACVVGMDLEADRQKKRIDPVAIVDGLW